MILRISAIVGLVKSLIITRFIHAIQAVPHEDIFSVATHSDLDFHKRIENTLDHVKLFLSDTKLFNPAITNADHRIQKYSDHFHLTTSLTNLAFNSVINVLFELGLTFDHMNSASVWIAAGDEISLILKTDKSIVFEEEISTMVEQNSGITVETTESNAFTSKKTTKVYETVKEYKYSFHFEYHLCLARGLGISAVDTLCLTNRSINQSIMLRSKNPDVISQLPAKETRVNVSWLFRRLKTEGTDHTFFFDINRADKDCHTPTNNRDVIEATKAIRALREWVFKARSLLTTHLFDLQSHFLSDASDPANAIDSIKLFSPVLPLFEYAVSSNQTEEAVSVTPSTMSALLREHKRGLSQKTRDLQPLFPSLPQSLVGAADAVFLSSLLHIDELTMHFAEGLDGVDNLVEAQVVAAIGKFIGPQDFAAYMQFHHRRLLKTEYQPSPFSDSVRRTPDHSPEGTIRIEEHTSQSTQPIRTLRRSVSAVEPMRFPLSAASTVSFKGERHLHMYLGHSFSQSSPSHLSLITQARQFSGFILLVGRVLSQTEFDPKYGIIVQNKDEINIPLLLDVIPTAKEFRDAIQSLSAEQQEFAKAIRNMQLGGTVFGVAVIQIKPHMEKVLNLLPNSLTKEIALSQDLMEMFIKYQISTDLLSFDGDSNELSPARVQIVKSYVNAIKDMIQKSKEDELKEKKLIDEANRKEMRDRGIVGEGMGEMVYMMSEMKEPPRMSRMKSMKSMDSMASASSLRGNEQSPEAAEYATTSSESVLRETAMKFSSSQNILLNDYSDVPSLLDKAHDLYDPDSPMRATLINPGDTWTLKSKRGLLQPETVSQLYASDLSKSKNDAFDLLDALSKSGALVLDHAELHIVFASTHAFDKSVMDTVVKGNVNPIERAERSLLIMASLLHGKPTAELVQDVNLNRLKNASPKLFLST